MIGVSTLSGASPAHATQNVVDNQATILHIGGAAPSTAFEHGLLERLRPCFLTGSPGPVPLGFRSGDSALLLARWHELTSSGRLLEHARQAPGQRVPIASGFRARPSRWWVPLVARPFSDRRALGCVY